MDLMGTREAGAASANRRNRKDNHQSTRISAWRGLALALTVFAPMLARAGVRDDVRICATLENTEKRLNCFDLIAKVISEATPTQQSSPTSVQSVVNNGAVKRLSAGDLAIQTHKWDGLLIETKLNCLSADKYDFRCFDAHSFARVRVDFSSLDEKGSDFLTNYCDTDESSNSQACFVKVRFVYSGYDTQETGGLLGRVVFVHPKDGYGQIVK